MLRGPQSLDAPGQHGTGGQMLKVLILDISIPFWVLKVFSGAGFKIREEFFLSDSF